jgi:glycosyltransferase involved in cell wall biosynthesis
MPAYNEETYIPFAIESILNQKFSDFEFIIVDDGSTDGTRDVIRSFDDNRIHLIENAKNRGRAHAANMGLKHASGEYIANMDADDIVHPNRLHAQVNILNANPNISIVGSSMYYIDTNNRILSERDFRERPSFNVATILDEGVPTPHGSSTIRKSAINGVGGYRRIFKRAQDLDLWLRLAEKLDEDTLFNIPKRHYYYRLDGGQLLHEVTAGSKIFKMVAQDAAQLRQSGQNELEALERLELADGRHFQNESKNIREAHRQYSNFRRHYRANNYYSALRCLAKPKLNFEFIQSMTRLLIHDLKLKLRR